MNRKLATIPILFLLCDLALQVQSLAAASLNDNIFSQRNCSHCHNLDDRNRATGGPPVAGMQLDGSLLDFGGSLWNHGPAMAKKAAEMKIDLPLLEARDIASLLSFVTAYQHFSKQRGSTGDPERGEIAWRGWKCAACHSIEGGNQKLGASLARYKDMSPVQMLQSMWSHSPEMVRAMSEHGIKPPRLSGKEMMNILAYIRSRTGMKEAVIYTELGDPLRGAEIFKKKQCVTCHPVANSSTQFGPQLERRKEFLEGTAGVAALMWNHSVEMEGEMKRAGMAIPSFEGTEMVDMLAYLYLSTYSEEAGDAIIGRKLFEFKKCMSCHPPGWRISEKTQQSALNIVASMWNHLPSMNPASGAAFAVIKPGEMKDLVAYLESIEPASP